VRAVLLLYLLSQARPASPQKPVPEPKAKQQQQPKTQGRTAQDSPPVVKVPHPKVAKQRPADVAKKNEQETTTDWTATGLLIVGAFQLVLFGGQLWLMWRVERTTKRQLRAYLFIENALISDP
jgi:hypothetical protein